MIYHDFKSSNVLLGDEFKPKTEMGEEASKERRERDSGPGKNDLPDKNGVEKRRSRILYECEEKS